MTTETPKFDALAEYYSHLSANGDKPMGEMPARLLMARIFDAMQEQRDIHREIITAAVEAINHIANRLREAGELMDAGQIAEARAIIKSQAVPLDASLLTSILEGGSHATH